MTPAPLIAHVLYRLDVGGLENGVVNLVNELPAERYRHALVCLTEATAFARRIRRPDVEIHALHKPPGNSVALHARLYRLFRRLRPAITHSRNLAALEAQAAAWLAGVPVRIHGEHGRDMGDLAGESRRHRRLRRVFRPLVHQYVAVSRDLEQYLRGPIGIDPARVTHIDGGVDTARFHPAARAPSAGAPFVVGTVLRMQSVKNPLLLARAFVRARELRPDARGRLRLEMVGDGPLLAEVSAFLAANGAAGDATLHGSRDDVAERLRGFDLFVLPSLAEGASNTLLEAMASGLPVVATRVGGTPELVDAGRTGTLVPSEDAQAMARSIVEYFDDRERGRREGQAGRARAVDAFSLQAQVASYQRLYDRWLG